MPEIKVITKNLGGAEDLLLDATTPAVVTQDRNGNPVAISKVNADTIPYSGKAGDGSIVSIKAKIDALIAKDAALDIEIDTLELKTVVATKVGTDNSTGSALLPKGNTLQRGATPVQGMIRYNTELDKFEGYTGTAWVAFTVV